MDSKVLESRRAFFEAWHRSKFATKHCTGQPTRDMHNGIYAETYWPNEQQQMWEAFNAALDAVEIELPADPNEEFSDRASAVEGCRAAIESTNLGLRVK